MRMLMNNLDPDVAENPDQLIVYGGTGRAARSWMHLTRSFVRSANWKTMSRCWFNPANRLENSGHTMKRRVF